MKLEREVFHGRAALEYALEPVPDAKRLLVTFPAMRAGASRPPTGRRRYLEGIPAHRLYLGADEHYFIGPQRAQAGMETAVELIGEVAQGLRIRTERVTCIGTSSGAGLALAVGLKLGAGRIVAGGAPVKAGTMLLRFPGEAKGRKASAAALVDLARTPDGDDPIAWLDRFIFDFAREASAPCRIDLITSAWDYSNDATIEFAAAARENPLLRCEVHFANYARHANVGDAFFPFVRKYLVAREKAPRAPSPPPSA